MNVSGTLNALRLLYNPWQFLPQITVSTFNQIPIPIPSNHPDKQIKVIVLDKDNCFAEPHKNTIWPDYEKHFDKLKAAYPGGVLIVSNTAGSQDDFEYKHAKILEDNTGVKVLKHTSKKPGCHEEIMSYVRSQGLADDASEVAIVGDRLMTDVVMANLMGATSVWVKDGVIPPVNILSKFEFALYRTFNGNEGNDNSKRIT